MANEWRSVCGETRPATAASRTHFSSRRRTSEGESRRPRRETNSAGSSRGAARARAGRARGSGAAPAGRARRSAPPASCEPLPVDAHGLGVEVEVAEVERDDLLGAQAARVGELEQRPVADLERRSRRDPVEQRGDLVAAEHPRQARARASAPAAGRRGCWSAAPVATRWACRPRTAASLRATLDFARPRSESAAA